MEGAATVHDTTSGIDTIVVAPVWPAGPTRVGPAGACHAPLGLPHGRGAGLLAYQQALGDGVRPQIASLLQVRLHGV